MKNKRAKRPSREFMDLQNKMIRCFEYGFWRPEPASRRIGLFDNLISDNPSIPVIPYARVSTEQQQLNGNLRDQINCLMRELENRNANIICEPYAEARNGSIYKRTGKLLEAFKLAREVKGVVVAISTDRILRPHLYNPRKNKLLKLYDCELEELGRLTYDVRLATIKHPDATESEVKSEHTRRGMIEKGHMGGRPPKSKPGAKKERKEKYLHRVIRLHNKGKSYRWIGNRFDIPYRTVAYWIKNYQVCNFPVDTSQAN